MCRDYGPPAKSWGKEEGASFQVIILVSTTMFEGVEGYLLAGVGSLHGSLDFIQNCSHSHPVHRLKQRAASPLLNVSGCCMKLYEANLVRAF